MVQTVRMALHRTRDRSGLFIYEAGSGPPCQPQRCKPPNGWADRPLNGNLWWAGRYDKVPVIDRLTDETATDTCAISIQNTAILRGQKMIFKKEKEVIELIEQHVGKLEACLLTAIDTLEA